MIKTKRWKDIIDLLNSIGATLNYAKILDIGCGDGWLDITLKENYYCDVSASDIKRKESKRWVNRLKAHGIEFCFCDITKENLPFEDNTFDIIFFLDVLEHLITAHPPYQIFEEIKRVCKVGSYLLLSTPDFAATHKRILALLGKNPASDVFVRNESYKKHFREYTVSELRYVLNTSGFKIKRISLKNYYFLASNPIFKLLTLHSTLRDTILILADATK